MKDSKILIAFMLAIAVLVSQFGAVLAAPALQEGTISGTVTGLVCEVDLSTTAKTFLVTTQGADGTSQTVRIDQFTADRLKLITINTDGSPDCSPEALENARGMEVTIDTTAIIPDEEENQHPVGAALATFFEEEKDITFEDMTTYDAIMKAHEEDGFGFGVIAQALWLTLKLESALPELSPEEIFQMILDAKQKGDFSEFASLFQDETPQNWGQFRKAVLDGDKKGNLGTVMSNKDNDNGNNGNNGNGQSNNNGNNQGNGNANSNKNKNKEIDRGNSEDKGNGHNK
jgi:hypothetical protein